MKITVKWLPAIICNTLLLTTIITFSLSHYFEHVHQLIPYISDTGTLPPESCLFGQILNILWILISFTMYIKYRQVDSIFVRGNVSIGKSLNKYALVTGLVAAFGASIVANFQETNLFIVHWIGAVMVFGLGALYQCMQTVLYLHVTSVIGQKEITKLRIALSAISLISFVTFFVGAMLSYAHFKGKDYLKWKKEDGGFEEHLVSTVSEWICATSTIVYISLFFWEFKKITIYEPEIFVEDISVTNVNLRQNDDTK